MLRYRVRWAKPLPKPAPDDADRRQTGRVLVQPGLDGRRARGAADLLPQRWPRWGLQRRLRPARARLAVGLLAAVERDRRRPARHPPGRQPRGEQAETTGGP